MGVLKNEVGRPSNKDLRIRTILKVVVIILSAAAILAGGYYIDGYQDKVTKKEDKEVEVKEPTMEERYPNVTFATKKIAENEITLVKINDGGIIEATNKRDNSTINVNIEDYENNGKAIIEFQNSYQSGITHYALLTEDNKIYISEFDPNGEKLELTFKQIKTKSEYIGITEEEIINSKNFSGVIYKPLFIYRKDAMYLLDCYDGKMTYGPRYGKRFITGAWNESGSIMFLVKGSNNKLHYLEELETLKIRKLKYKLKDITVKFIMQTSKDIEQVNYVAYVITEDNKILYFEMIGEDEDSNQEQINNIKLYKKGVESYETNNQDMTVTVKYDDGSIEKFENLSAYQEYKPIEDNN